MMLPDARGRSPTAVDGISALRDENVYSAACVAHGAAGVVPTFTAPKGAPIPTLTGVVVAPLQAHQRIYTLLTTNLSKAGEPGSSLGDLAIRAIGISIEAAAYALATGVPRTFGATQFEVADILAKMYLEFKISGKKQVEGPFISFGNAGSMSGSTFSTGGGSTVSTVNNGGANSIRRFKLPIPVGRTDVVEGNLGVAGGSALAFNTAGAGPGTDGQPCLVWVISNCVLSGDAR
jgi:hypothetical protein